jgi:hypothetical protein
MNAYPEFAFIYEERTFKLILKSDIDCSKTVIYGPGFSGIKYWWGPKAGGLVSEFNWANDSLSNQATDPSKAGPVDPYNYYCGDRVY